MSGPTPPVVSTVVLGQRPPELERFLQQRRALGQDLYDEVWRGTYHVPPAAGLAHGRVQAELAVVLRAAAERTGLVMTGPFNFGGPDDYRVPDQGWHRVGASGTWLPTAALVVEVVSPGDESYDKLDFYATHLVDEVLVADPQLRQVRLWQLGDDGYDETGRSALLDVTAADLTAQLDWPPVNAG